MPKTKSNRRPQRQKGGRYKDEIQNDFKPLKDPKDYQRKPKTNRWV